MPRVVSQGLGPRLLAHLNCTLLLILRFDLLIQYSTRKTRVLQKTKSMCLTPFLARRGNEGSNIIDLSALFIPRGIECFPH